MSFRSEGRLSANCRLERRGRIVKTFPITRRRLKGCFAPLATQLRRFVTADIATTCEILGGHRPPLQERRRKVMAGNSLNHDKSVVYPRPSLLTRSRPHATFSTA